MDQAQFKSELTRLLPGFTVEENQGCYYGIKQIQARTYRDADRALIVRPNIRHFFVSDVMYKDNPDMQSFRYMMIYCKVEKREHNRKLFYETEIDKYFLSDPTDQGLIDKLEKLSLEEASYK